MKSHLFPSGSGEGRFSGSGRGYWRTYEMTDGLGSPYVEAALEDRDGCFWFGTEAGVGR